MSKTWGLDVRGKRGSDFELANHTVMVVIMLNAGLLEEVSDGEETFFYSFGYVNLVQHIIDPTKCACGAFRFKILEFNIRTVNLTIFRI